MLSSPPILSPAYVSLPAEIPNLPRNPMTLAGKTLNATPSRPHLDTNSQVNEKTEIFADVDFPATPLSSSSFGVDDYTPTTCIWARPFAAPSMSIRTNSTGSSSSTIFSRGSSHASTGSAAFSFSSFVSTSSCAIPTLPPYAPNPVMVPSPEDAKAVLTMDGGGVRGVFAPLFLQALQKHLPPEIDIRQLLDLVGGTSTGGVAALMFARMGLPLEDVVDVYKTMPKKLFGRRKLKSMWWLFTNAQHSTKRQRKIFSRVVRDALGNAEAQLKPQATDAELSPDRPHVPVFTVAIDTEDLSRPTLFSSYTPTFEAFCKTTDSLPSISLRDDVPVVVAALATSAAPTYFHPATHAGRQYIDGGVGFNNPSELALKQLSALYGPTAYAHTLISLGTGRRNENPYRPAGQRKRSGIAGVIDVLRVFAHISTDAEGVHERLEERFALTGAYFRFNPVGLEDVVLDDWTAVDSAVKASKAYLEQPDTQKRLAELADRLLKTRFML